MRERDGGTGRLDARATRGRGGLRKGGVEGTRARSKLIPHGRLNAETRHLLYRCLRISLGAGSMPMPAGAGKEGKRGARLHHETMNCLYKI
jgi:hypothetical protein